jgi:hypothetical protein
VVRETDSERGTDYDAQIRDAIARCERGDKPKVAQQTVAKGLQHVAVLAISSELDCLAAVDPQARSRAAAKVVAYLKGIRPTFVRRDADFFPQANTLRPALDQAVERLSRAARSGGAEVVAARRDLEDLVARVYALSLLYELMKIEELRAKDLPACEVKLAEAVVFYRIIAPRVEKRAPQAHATIAAMLGAGYEAMSAATIEEQLERGLPGIPLR